MFETLHVLRPPYWFHLDPETGELVGWAPDLASEADDYLMDRLRRMDVPPSYPLFYDISGVTKEKLAGMDPRLARAYWRAFERSPISGSDRRGE